MYWTESFNFWWLVPVLMILFCLFMCFARRRWGMASCGMGWCGPPDVSRDRRTDDGDRRCRTDTSMSAEETAEAEGLKRTFDRLERRLRNLEEAVTSKEFDWNRRLHRS